MKYRYRFVESKFEDCPDTIEFGKDGNIPYYAFKSPKGFFSFGLYDLMEGVYTYEGLSKEEVRNFLNGLGYIEI